MYCGTVQSQSDVSKTWKGCAPVLLSCTIFILSLNFIAINGISWVCGIHVCTLMFFALFLVSFQQQNCLCIENLGHKLCRIKKHTRSRNLYKLLLIKKLQLPWTHIASNDLRLRVDTFWQTLNTFFHISPEPTFLIFVSTCRGNLGLLSAVHIPRKRALFFRFSTLSANRNFIDFCPQSLRDLSFHTLIHHPIAKFQIPLPTSYKNISFL